MTEPHVRKLLLSLGQYPTDVADKFAALGIKGPTHDPRCCPLARWLQQELHDESVTAGVTFVRVQGKTYATPAAVHDFIERFDRGCYPSLLGKSAIVRA